MEEFLGTYNLQKLHDEETEDLNRVMMNKEIQLVKNSPQPPPKNKTKQTKKKNP